MFDDQGYVRIGDYGLSRSFENENKWYSSGTPAYMAPEVMCRQNHGVSIDFYSLGVILYELMLKKLPYKGKNRTEIREKIMANQIQIKKHEIPEGWSLESADFINRLIQRKPTNRLGFNGALELMNHGWLKNYPWGKLRTKILTSQDKIKLYKLDKKFLREVSTKSKDSNTYEAKIEAEFIEEKRSQLEKDSIQSKLFVVSKLRFICFRLVLWLPDRRFGI